MALAVEEDVPLDPVNVRLLCPTAVVASAEGGAHAVEEAGLLRRRRPGFPGNPPRPSTTGRSRIPKGDRSLGANHRQFPRSQERKRDGSGTQDDHPKSWDGTLWASGERPPPRARGTKHRSPPAARV